MNASDEYFSILYLYIYFSIFIADSFMMGFLIQGTSALMPLHTPSMHAPLAPSPPRPAHLHAPAVLQALTPAPSQLRHQQHVCSVVWARTHHQGAGAHVRHVHTQRDQGPQHAVQVMIFLLSQNESH